MNEPIIRFDGDYKWLSNFYVGKPFKYKGVTFNNGEAAFQHAKSVFAQDVNNVAKYDAWFKPDTPPNEAKKLGRSMKINLDEWEKNKDFTMRQVIWCKFTQDPVLEKKLLKTGYSMLVEGNDWNDTYWGRCEGKGYNVLGVLLMQLRGQLGPPW